MNKINKMYTIGFIATLLGGFMWGFSGACAQYIFSNYDVIANWLVPVRLFTSGLLMVIYLLFKNGKELFKIFHNKKDSMTLLIYAAFGLVLCQYTYFLSIELSNAAVATVLEYTAPAIIFLIVTLKTKKLPKKREFLALILASMGIFLVATHGSIESMVISKEAFIAGILSAFGVVGFTMIPININQKYGVPSNLAWALFISGLIMIFALRIWNLDAIDDFKGFLAFVFIVLFGTIGAFLFYLWGVKIIGPKRASVLSTMEPISAAFFSYFWLGTPLIWIDFLGFGAIIVCTYLLRK